MSRFGAGTIAALTLALAGGCGGGGSVAPEEMSSLPLPEGGAASYGAPAEAGDLSRRAAAIAEAALGRKVKPSAALEAAAKTLGRRLRSGCRTWPDWMEEAVLYHSGWSDGGADAVLLCAGSKAPFFRQIEESLPRFPHTTHVGAARVRLGWTHSAWVLLMGEQEAELSEFPRSMESGEERRFSFRLSERVSRPSVYHLSPDDDVRRLDVREGPGPREYYADFSADSPAEHWIELMAVGREGPTVVALVPVYVGVSPPSSVERPHRPELKADSSETAESHLLRLANQERARRGIPEVKSDERLGRIARSYSEEMRARGRIAHTAPDGRGPKERAYEAGYPALMLSENLSKQSDVVEAHRSLMASPAHRAAMLSSRVTHAGMGVAIADEDGRQVLYVTQEFAVPQRDLSSMEVEERVRELIEEFRDRLGLDSASESTDLYWVAQDVLAAADRQEALGRALRERRVSGLVAANVQTVGDPDEFVVPSELQAEGDVPFGIAARVVPGEGPLQSYVVSLVIRQTD